ncbi:hypothetical protein INT47_009132 [Mucor saturninus]|uniref:G protein gamma domain-containing protein n=1 Tax=Mucor saturninus TaxID=64648 RepID=A0A8H7VEF1_9FUNG|nr:hypothetical protein INT47_009132 [Mucor saturninus]
MLDFQKEILTDIAIEDALVITSPGLGLFQILCRFIQLYTKGNHLVLLINTSKEQVDLIGEQLIAHGVSTDHIIRRIEYNTPSEKRTSMYREGGVFAITSRILAVDMLLERIPTTLINGIIVYNAHRIKPNSIEELILRIYRNYNQEGFIKAFSDQPDAFVTGFAPLQSRMKSLFLRKVHLWPRFQLAVSENLSQTNNDVIELRQPMTPMMDTIQTGLVQCMEETLAELRRSNPTLDVTELTIENTFFKSFDLIVRQQLDPIWHNVSFASKQLVSDLKILRQLLSFIETVIEANNPKEGKQIRQSQWLFLEAGDRVIQTARQRVYVKKGDTLFDELPDTPLPQGFPSHIKLVLEEQPKWNLLKNVLAEIENDAMGLNHGEGAPVLIMVNERRTCSQLKKYITKNNTEDSFLSPMVRNYFQWRSKMFKIQKSTASSSTPPAQAPQRRGGPPMNKRRRVRGGSSAASGPGRTESLAETFKEDVIETVAVLDEGDDEFKLVGPVSDEYEITRQEHDILPSFREIDQNKLIAIQCYDDDLNEQILQDIEPRFIIMFDPNPAFVRQIEVYRALHPTVQIRVYFMLYENSIMAIPMPEKKREEHLETVRLSTRMAGGQVQLKGPPVVTVDMREFRSSLPPILYAEGMKIEPFTLQVGDYILSPDMCVERKSISDLIQSFASGRLITQCEIMALHYKTPILLIEFDQNKSFSLQALEEMKGNISSTDISSKLVLLTLAVPKLRIIWSSSPQETAKIFTALKKSEPEPDSKQAASIGAEAGEDGETIYNMTPQDILRSMPGVTSKNYKIIMNGVQDLDELMHLSQKRIENMIGVEMVSETKLRKILELNSRLKQQLDIPRIPVSEASRSLIDYCQSTSDLMLPSIWGNRHPDPFAEPANGCGGSCQIM